MREKLIEVRIKKGYTQEQMANKLNIARTTYTGYEKGNVNPSLEVALIIKKILNYRLVNTKLGDRADLNKKMIEYLQTNTHNDIYKITNNINNHFF